MNLLRQPPSVVVPLVEFVASFYPEPIRVELEAAIPALSLDATRLGLEVLAAEQQGIRFSEAVIREGFPLMERVNFGAQAMLQHRLPPTLRDAAAAMLAHGLNGGFDSIRKLTFAAAIRPHDADAALCRFLLWVGIRINLLVETWDEPAAEANGTLDAMDDRAEDALREFLAFPELIHDPDVRPLHLLVGEMLIRTGLESRDRFALAVEQYGAELTEIMANALAIEEVRKLDDRHAVLFLPGRFAGQPGSVQIASRYPMQHKSAAALEQTASRFRRRRSKVLADPPRDRFIDLLRDHSGGGE